MIQGNNDQEKDLNNDVLGMIKPQETKLQQDAQELTRDQMIRKRFKKGVLLEQPQVLSRSIMWTIIGVTVVCIGWASFAKIEQVVPAQGQLKPLGKVKDIQAPVGGVVKEVLVKDNDQVEKDQVLVVFDTSSSEAQLVSQQQILQYLSQETKFYRTVMSQPLNKVQLEQEIARLQLPKEVGALAKSRSELLEENQMFTHYLENKGNVSNLSPAQKARLAVTQAESSSRLASARLETEQFQKQLSQNQVKLGDAKAKLATDKEVLEQIRQRNQQEIAQAEESLEIEKKVLKEIEPLKEEGAIATTQIERQRLQVNDRVADLIEKRSKGRIDYNNQKQQVESRLAEINEISEEQKRLGLAIEQAREKFNNTKAFSEKDIRDRMADNEKRIAEIDSQFTKLIVENEKRIAETNSQISNSQQTLRYQELRAPVAGKVFDLKAFPGFVPQPSQAEALLKIVPNEDMIAEVYVTNQDIGFVREGLKVDIRVDSFPFSEFGDIKGEVISVASDALPPDQIHDFYRFPIKIHMDRQYLQVSDRKLDLQSGMSVTANIKVNENRTVLNLFTDLFNNKLDSLKEVR